MKVEIDKVAEWYRKNMQENTCSHLSDKTCECPNGRKKDTCMAENMEAFLDKLMYQLDYDELTDIYNIDKFYREVSSLLTENPDKKYAIVRLDFDRFEITNDLFGTQEGDKILRYVGTIFKKIKREDFRYARVISDVFALCVSYKEDSELLELVREIEQGIREYPIECRLAPYFGIYRITDRNIPVSIMVDYSKLACRSIKGNVINNYAFYEDKLREQIIREVEIERDMEIALEEGQFKLFLQPKYDIATGRITGAEALCRWIHPKKGLLSPDKFIPLFERNGFIIKLDRFMWEEVCKAIRNWIDKGLDVVPVSINISRIHAYNSTFEGDIISLVEKYQIPPNYLELELTESAYLTETETIFRSMGRLKEKGLLFSVDDFGTGYSSLNMLKNIPVDIVKLDREFLSESTNDRKGHIIIKNMISLVNELDLKVIAEGVENLEQEEFLLQMGCNTAQGYYFSRPLSLADFEKKTFGSKESGCGV